MPRLACDHRVGRDFSPAASSQRLSIIMLPRIAQSKWSFINVIIGLNRVSSYDRGNSENDSQFYNGDIAGTPTVSIMKEKVKQCVLFSLNRLVENNYAIFDR